MAFPNENQKIFMVTGKGGVGKSVVAAALAQKAARSGLKTLLVELGEQSYYQHIYKRPIHYEATPISTNFSISIWNGESCLKEYVYYLVKVRAVVDLFFNNRVMRSFIKAAPALKELAILGKITSGIRKWGPELPYDLIVVDAFATGHFQALLNAPKGMAELIETGPMGEQSRNMSAVLERADLVKYKIVTLPEELPVSEAIEQHQSLKNTFHVEPEIYLNRFYTSQLSQSELGDAREKSADIGAKQFAEYLMNLNTQQDSQKKSLVDAIGKFEVLPWILKSDVREVIDALEVRLS